jgi:RHS repeat-associated protein
MQENHYDPWGVAIEQEVVADTSKLPKFELRDRFTYNGKELQGTLNYLDYDARMYDPSIGRWGVVDPLAALDLNLSPYNYVGNNPLAFVDLFGLERVPVGPNGGYYDLEKGEAGVVAQRLSDPEPYTMLEYASKAYDRNQKLYGHPSPYREHFQKGGEDAIKIIGGSIAAVYGVSVGVTQGLSFLARSRALSIARQIIKSPIKNNYLNIGKFNVGAALGDFIGQLATNRGDISKINLVGTAAQLTIGGTNFLASVASSGVGSVFSFTVQDAFDNNGIFGFTANSIFEGKTWANFALGTVGNLGAGAIGGQFAKAYQPNAFDKGVMETGLNTLFGFGAGIGSESLIK